MSRLFAAAPAGRTLSEDVLLVCRLVRPSTTHDSPSIQLLTLGLASTFPDMGDVRMAVGSGKPTTLLVFDGEPEVYGAERVALRSGTMLSWELRINHKDDPSGPLVAPFRGDLPVSATRGSTTVECRGYDEDAQAAARASRAATIDALLKAPVRDRRWRTALEDIVDELTALKEVDGFAALKRVDDPHIAKADEQLARDFDRERVQAMRDAATPFATWVAIDDAIEVRANGLLCRPSYGKSLSCGIELDIRARKGDATLCPYDDSALGGLAAYAHFTSGSRWALNPVSVSRSSLDGIGAFVTRREELQPGAEYIVELEAGGTIVFDPDSSKAPANFDVVVIEIRRGGDPPRYLRAY